jgi:hypothetical protein
MLKDRKISKDPAPKIPLQGGRPRPDYRGTVIGQSVCSEQKFPTGKKIPFVRVDPETGEEETSFMQVKEKRTVAHWVWDGAHWITGPEWDDRCLRSVKVSTKFPSKNDFNAVGERPIRSGRK